MTDSIDLSEKLAAFSEHWSPRTVAQFNDCDVMVVKVKGEFVWHKHDDTDDFFLVLKGVLDIELRDRIVTLSICSCNYQLAHSASVSKTRNVDAQEGFIPGAAHLEELDPVCIGLDLPCTSLDEAPGLVLNNSSGFGGSNVCHVLRRLA